MDFTHFRSFKEKPRRTMLTQYELMERFSLPNSSRDIEEIQKVGADGQPSEHRLRWKEFRKSTDNWFACEWNILEDWLESEDGSPILYVPSLPNK